MNNDELVVKIVRLEEFKNKCENDLNSIKLKMNEEINELKSLHTELKNNLDKINVTLIRIQYTIIGGGIMFAIFSMGFNEFFSKIITKLI